MGVIKAGSRHRVDRRVKVICVAGKSGKAAKCSNVHAGSRQELTEDAHKLHMIN